ncbi:heavy metal translocating P-type ATPase [Psychroserpens ponticola]|uniref:Cation transporter n=1 Tax=Psychroserpens ponticola TaxID=2932268 RepID=A0ABY7RYX2_9FLAO|nr:MauE/DoxX family redox-associated membrane protein [Psychroserpens ponticola]WCO02257.1 cation transporter [Psychroserpens ponticola]
MTRTYSITGMTCNNCKASVEKALKSIDSVENISIDLEKSKAIIEMSNPVSVETLQNGLPSKYTILDDSEVNIFNSSTSEKDTPKSEFRQLFPLFIIFGYIIGASILLNNNPWSTTSFMLDFMGLFYIVFSFFKLLDLKGFPDSFRMYDPLAKRIPVYGWLYPFIELGLGLLFLMRMEITLALVITLVILGVTTFGVIRTLWSKKSIQCACLGTALKLPMTKATFIENSIMITMAVVMLLKSYN